ncbi:MAG: HK97 family phage prohead protease [Limimaricola soesokkakensis]|uniref:HK97 family phage prohead protease n=1 Tax=Limimaricola soesokkakensis TaxID=1343159 RepID=UPI0040593FB9
MTKREIRAALPAELTEADDQVRVAGHAAIYNERANIGGYFEERIAPGAFDAILGADDVPFLIEHDGLPLARTGSGTLTLTADKRGLYIETTLDPSDPDVARIVPKMKRGDLSKMSFAFSVATEEWDETGEIPLRTITGFRKLYDVAIVTNPAYAGTDIGLRSLEAARAAAEAAAGMTQATRAAVLGNRLRLLG